MMFERFDFATYQSASAAERDAFCNDLVASLRTYGFVKLVNHGISPSLIDQAFDSVCVHFSDYNTTS